MRHSQQTLPIHSRALRRTLPCTLLRPAAAAPQAVAYLLHGGYSHHREWAEKMDLAEMASPWPLALALPEGEFSLWVHGHDGQNWERYAAFDVPEAVEAHLGLHLGQQQRAVAGLSMGGFGALHLGLTYPGRYRAVASLSGAFGMTVWHIGRFEGSPFLRALGPVGSGTRAWVEPTKTLGRALARQGGPPLPHLWLVTGTEDDDEVTQAHHALRAALQEAHIPHTLLLQPGGHSWAFWAQQTPALLAFLAEALGLRPMPTSAPAGPR